MPVTRRRVDYHPNNIITHPFEVMIYMGVYAI
jgi:hypothetical protein